MFALLLISFHFVSFFSRFSNFSFVIFQIHIVQAMSALLCCGPCFDSQYLTEDGLIYPWLDTLLISTDDKVRFDSRIIMFLPIQILNVETKKEKKTNQLTTLHRLFSFFNCRFMI